MQPRFMTLGRLIEAIRADEPWLREPYDVYAAEQDAEIYGVETQVFLDAPVVVTDALGEVLPEAVASRGLEVFCLKEHLHDVVESAVHQKPEASAAEIAAALKHYMVHDDFLDFD